MTEDTRNDKKRRIEDMRSRNHQAACQQKIDRGYLVDEVTGALVEPNNSQAFAEAADVMDGFRTLSQQMPLGMNGENNLIEVLDTLKELAAKLKVTYDDESDAETLILSGMDGMIEGWRDQAERYRERG